MSSEFVYANSPRQQKPPSIYECLASRGLRGSAIFLMNPEYNFKEVKSTHGKSWQGVHEPPKMSDPKELM